MVVDTSAVVAILIGEIEGDAFWAKLKGADTCHMSAVTLYECRVVLGARGREAMLADLNSMVRELPIVIAAFDELQADLSHMAYRRYGKGSGHPARFNFGDCAAYALATSLGLPLLYKGSDFSKTDVVAAA